MFHEQRIEHPFLGQKLATDGGTSDATAHAIEDEARRILAEALDEADRALAAHRPQLEALAAALIEHETLEQDEVEKLLGARVEDLGSVPIAAPIPPTTVVPRA